jgi:hypothetical protein
MTLWDKYYEYSDFQNQAADKQQELLAELKVSTDDYRFANTVESVIPYVDKDDAIELFKAYVAQVVSNRYHSMDVVISAAMKHDAALTKELIVASSNYHIHKLLLTLPGISISEEVLGLRALAKSTQCPYEVRGAKYQPSFEALKQLPTMMRLNCLNSLSDMRLPTYNVFGKITDADEFRLLLFGSTFKKLDKVEVIWKRYCEMTALGTPRSIKAAGNCERCGVFEITLSNMVVGKVDSLDKTRIGHMMQCYCPICGGFMKEDIVLTEQDWIHGGTNGNEIEAKQEGNEEDTFQETSAQGDKDQSSQTIAF